MQSKVFPAKSIKSSFLRNESTMHSDLIQMTYVVIGIAAAITCCSTPFLYGLKFDYGHYSSYEAPITSSIQSEIFKKAVVGCFSISLPVALDYVLDVYLLSSKCHIQNGFFERGLLIVALVMSNLIILNCVIPSGKPAMLFTIFHIHFIAIIVCAYSYLYKFGSPVFNRKLTIISGSFTCVGILFQQLILFSQFQSSDIILSILYITFIIGYMAFFYMIFQWFMQIWKFNRNEMTLNQYGSSVYAISLSIILLGLLVIIIVKPCKFPELSPSALSGICYIVGSFTILIAILPGRMARQESVQAKVIEIIFKTLYGNAFIKHFFSD